jgi:hypothetical protein
MQEGQCAGSDEHPLISYSEKIQQTSPYPLPPAYNRKSPRDDKFKASLRIDTTLYDSQPDESNAYDAVFLKNAAEEEKELENIGVEEERYDK